MCSLFSLMFGFVDHQAAVATAQAVMQGLMDEENIDPTSTHEKEIECLWRGESAAPTDQPVDEKLLKQPNLEERLQQPISRRDMLRGNLSREP